MVLYTLPKTRGNLQDPPVSRRQGQDRPGLGPPVLGGCWHTGLTYRQLLHTGNTQLSAHWILITTHCTLHTAYCTLLNAHWAQHTSYCTLNTVQCTLNTLQCTLHTAHWKPLPSGVSPWCSSRSEGREGGGQSKAGPLSYHTTCKDYHTTCKDYHTPCKGDQPDKTLSFKSFFQNR